jgi:polyphosphate glucokinase
VGNHALLKKGKKKWRRHVADVVARLVAALEPDEVVLGGGNVKELKKLPPKCRAGDNRNAFRGGFRLWEANEPQSLPHPGATPNNQSTGKDKGNGNNSRGSKLASPTSQTPGLEGSPSPL